MWEMLFWGGNQQLSSASSSWDMRLVWRILEFAVALKPICLPARGGKLPAHLHTSAGQDPQPQRIKITSV